MNKQELIKHFEEMEYVSVSQMGKKAFIDLIEQLNEPQKPVVPQFVADWYEKNKDSFDYNLWEYLTEWERQEPSDFKNWINDKDIAFQTLVNMHQFGYEVEKEKRYIVKVKGVEESHKYLNHRISLDSWFFSGENEPLDFSVKHTHKELEEANFGWVFDCEGIEIEEVEE